MKVGAVKIKIQNKRERWIKTRTEKSKGAEEEHTKEKTQMVKKEKDC